MLPTHEPARFTSHEHKNARRRRRLLMSLIGGLYLLVFLFGIGAVLGLSNGEFSYGIGSLILGTVSFICWAVLLNHVAN